MSLLTLAARCRRWHLSAALLVLLSPLAAWATALQPGHAGHWTAPERDGEGWVLELLDADTALLYWFTYDESGNQRWLTAVGELRADDEGEYLAFPELVVTRGARFGAAFDPDDVIREAVGSGWLRFQDCERATFGFQAYGQTLSIPLSRLAHLMGSACERPHGMTGRPSAAHAGLSGSWYDPLRSGEGYALQWINPEQAIVTWYTYDTAGRQYWLIGEGRFDGQGRIVAQVHATRGGRFGAAFDPDRVERFFWGSVALEIDCEGGPAVYASDLPGFGDGLIELQRLTANHRVGCPWQAPTLAELYTLELDELDSAVSALPGAVASGSLASLGDSGAIWTTTSGPGGTGQRAVTLQSGASQWQTLGSIGHAGRLWVAAQGELLVSTWAASDGSTVPVRWSGDAWSPIDPGLGEQARVTGVSSDGEVVLLQSRPESPGTELAWRWRADTGALELPMQEHSSQRVTALFAGIDDGPVIGLVDPVRPPGASTTRRALLWTGPMQSPETLWGPPVFAGQPWPWMLLEPAACAGDCSVVFGNATMWTQPSPPALNAEPWYRLADGRSALLGRLPDEDPRVAYAINGASLDGSIVAGRARVPYSFSFGAEGLAGQDDWAWDGFVWTQHIGMVSLRALLDGAGLALDGWRDAEVAAVSPNGLRLLISGNRQGPGAPGVMTQGLAVLTLVPRDGTQPLR